MIQPSKLAVILQFFSQKYKFEWTRLKFYPQSEQMKGHMKELLKTEFNLQSKLLFCNSIHRKTHLNKQGQNSFHNQSKWKAAWRISFLLDSAFKASCYSAILFTKKPVWMNKAEILSIIRANEAAWRSSKTEFNLLQSKLVYWNSIHKKPVGINKAKILSTNKAN